MRVPLVAANWKMNKTVGETLSFAGSFLPEIQSILDAEKPWPELLICPPFTSIPALSSVLASKPVAVGAQDVHWEIKGAFTGEISPLMLRDLGCKYVIVGHSERRRIMGESGDMIAKKVRAALDGGLKPILCVGETLEERERGDALRVNADMTGQGLSQVSADEVASVVIAYEPVWAIGSGKEAKSDDAREVAAEIRRVIDGLFGKDAAAEVRVLYGGSVKASNIRPFILCEEIDGALVGGASLDPAQFAKLAQEVRKARPRPRAHS